MLIIINEIYYLMHSNYILWLLQDKTLNIRLLRCKENECNDISDNTCAILLPIKNEQTWIPIFFKDVDNLKDLVEKVLERLPEPKSLSDNEFQVTSL